MLAVFLTAGAVRGDADRGLVQPLVVRPVGRASYLAGRGLAAIDISRLATCSCLSVLATVTTRLLFSNLPPNAWQAILPLVAGVCVVTVVTLLVSCVLSTVATGISVLMAYGAGLVAGLLGEIGRSFDATTLTRIADGVCYALPFEALYRDALSRCRRAVRSANSCSSVRSVARAAAVSGCGSTRVCTCGCAALRRCGSSGSSDL